jgi:hypothetical protein
MRLPFERNDAAGFILVWLATLLFIVAMAAGELGRAAAQDGAARERPQAFNGANQTPIAPTYNDANGNLSFVRFFNANSTTPSTFAVTVVGSPSGNTYGSVASFTVPANASHQRSLTEILSAAGAGALTSGDTNYTLYVRNADGFSAFQHVIFNSTNRFFESATICQFFSGAQHVRVIPLVANMHTSRLPTYPSEITVHNYTAATRAYTARVYDAVSGTQLGSVPLTVTANTTARLSTAAIEQEIGFTPSSSQFHMNIRVGDASSPDDLTAVLGHTVQNTEFNGTAVNLTQLCRVKS